MSGFFGMFGRKKKEEQEQEDPRWVGSDGRQLPGPRWPVAGERTRDGPPMLMPRGGDQEAITEGYVELETTEGKFFWMHLEACEKCDLLRDMVSDLEEESVSIPLAKISTPVMEVIGQYLQIYSNHPDRDPMNDLPPAPLRGNLLQLLPDLTRGFVTQHFLFSNTPGGEATNVDDRIVMEKLCAVLMGANFLGCRSLRALCAAVLGDCLRRSSGQEVLNLFGYEDEVWDKEKMEAAVGASKQLKEYLEVQRGLTGNRVSPQDSQGEPGGPVGPPTTTA